MDGIDYYKIGQRIRRVRKARGTSQEDLAEHVGISTTHMSHIETANTKLSLPVLVSIANYFEIPVDLLLFDEPQDNLSLSMKELLSVIEGCTPKEARIIIETVKSIKQSLDAYL